METKRYIRTDTSHQEVARKRQRLVEEKNTHVRLPASSVVARLAPAVGKNATINRNISEFIHHEGCDLWAKNGQNCARSFVYRDAETGQEQLCASYCADHCIKWIKHLVEQPPSFVTTGDKQSQSYILEIMVLIQGDGDYMFFNLVVRGASFHISMVDF